MPEWIVYHDPHKVDQGEWTKVLVARLREDLSAEPTERKIMPFLGKECNTETELAHVDIAICDKKSGRLKVLCEVEETEEPRPKTVAGDIMCVLLSGGRIRIAGENRGFDDPYLVLGLNTQKEERAGNLRDGIVDSMEGRVDSPLASRGRIKIVTMAGEELDGLVESEKCERFVERVTEEILDVLRK